MHGKVKLTKREIKEDKFATFMLTAKDRVTDNWQFTAIGAAVVVLLAAAVIFFISNQRTSRVEASEKFANAQMEYRSGNTQVAVSALNQIVSDYSGETAKSALFLLGRISYETKNYPEAVRYWEQFADKYKSDRLNYAAALAGVAACNENQAQFVQAATKFNEAIQAYPDGPAVSDYIFGEMRSYLEAGDIEKAKANLAELKTKFANTQVTSRAIRLFAEKDPTASTT